MNKMREIGIVGKFECDGCGTKIDFTQVLVHTGKKYSFDSNVKCHGCGWCRKFTLISFKSADVKIENKEDAIKLADLMNGVNNNEN
jgi:uncharacterized Zn finger protein